MVQERSRRTREAIIEGAAEVFALRGYERTSTRDIQAAANVKKGALYHHFPTKKDIAAAVVEHGFMQDAVLLQEPRLQDIVDAGMVLAHRTTRIPAVRAAARLATEQDHEFFGALWKSYVPLVADLFRQADELGELLPGVHYEHTSLVWVASYTGLDLMKRLETDPDELERTISIMYRTLLRGVAKPEVLDRIDAGLDRGARLVEEASKGLVKKAAEDRQKVSKE
ncbi:ScbR family autoregulator-binding transcription factor [Streptomyces sp. NPDC050204]|uniref:ScbR family autoregulator-binding transcription factor n=1 Tax=Streptomyces sp. NPDC050204 TaxID=3155514 RepID=UPI0034429CAE